MRCLQLTCKLIFANNVASSSSVTKTSVTFGSLPKFFYTYFSACMWFCQGQMIMSVMDVSSWTWAIANSVEVL